MNPRPATLLIVDDEPRNCRLLEALLRPEGYLTCTAGSGTEALRAVAAQAPDLILLDVMMPGMSGYEVAATLKRDPATSAIPVIMITARSDRAARLDGLAAGAEDFLTKPVDRTELWLRVRNLLRLKAFADFQRDHATLLEQHVQARTRELQQFRSAMDSTADAILLIEPVTMRFIEVNATACRMFGYDRAALFAAGPPALWADSRDRQRHRPAETAPAHAGTLTEARMRRSDGELFDAELHQQVQRDGDGWLMVVGVRDVSERKEAEARLYRLAHHDTLTGLPNRLLFHRMLTQALVRASADDRQVAVAVIDLDQFKDVNDTLGQASGDQLLALMAVRLSDCARGGDAAGRLGSDEFVLMRTLAGGDDDVAAFTETIRTAVHTPYRINDGELTLAASVGIAVFPADATDASTLLRNADTAMGRVKHSGRDSVALFTAQMSVDLLARLELEGALRQALADDEFELHYQPMMDVASGRIAGLEALLRWQRPGHGPVSPAEFVPLLEETGLIVRVGTWVVAEACRQIAAWRAETGVEVRVSVNVSSRQLVEGDLQADVGNALQTHAVAGSLLELELTESALMVNTDQAIAILDALRRSGVGVSIDDFGTGYSSLAYLRRFPIDKLKIDITFIRDITRSADDATIALAIIGLAHSLRLAVVAEGVETAEQFHYLREHRCDQVQGFYFSRPLPAADVARLLREGRADRSATAVVAAVAG